MGTTQVLPILAGKGKKNYIQFQFFRLLIFFEIIGCEISPNSNGKSTKQKSLCIFLWIEKFVSKSINSHIYIFIFINLKSLIESGSGFVDDDKVLDYKIHREKLIKKGIGVSFKTAVQHIDEYSSDSIVSVVKIQFFYS